MFLPIRWPRQAKKYRVPLSPQPLIAKRRFLRQEGCVSGDFPASKKCSSDLASKIKAAARSFEKKLTCAGNREKFFKYLGSCLKSPNARGVVPGKLAKVVNEANTQSEVFATFFDSVFIKDNGILPDLPVRAGGFLRNVDCSCENVFKSMLELND